MFAVKLEPKTLVHTPKTLPTDLAVQSEIADANRLGVSNCPA
jgi:hypothetical protein